MAQIRAYKIVSSSTSAGSAIATITIPRNGLITALLASTTNTSGAAASSGMETEVSLSSVTTLQTNDTPGNSLATIMATGNVSGGQNSANYGLSNLGIPVNAGDKIYLHQNTVGTAPAANFTCVHLFIMH